MCQNLILIIVWLRKLCYTGGYIQVYRIRYNKNNCNKYAHNFIIIQISFISLFFKFFFLKSFRSYIDAIWASFLYYEGISVADQYSEKKGKCPDPYFNIRSDSDTIWKTRFIFLKNQVFFINIYCIYVIRGCGNIYLYPSIYYKSQLICMCLCENFTVFNF